MNEVLPIALMFGVLILAMLFVAFREQATLAVSSGYGRTPDLPAPDPSLVPVVNNAAAIGLRSEMTPVAAERFRVRNPNGLAWRSDNGALRVAVNERDEIGSDLVPIA